MTTPPPLGDGNPAGRFLGGVLMAIGGLIGGLSGLCTAGMVVVMLVSPGDAGAFVSGLAIVAVVGGVPIAIGVGLFLLGRMVYRNSKPKPDPDTFS